MQHRNPWSCIGNIKNELQSSSAVVPGNVCAEGPLTLHNGHLTLHKRSRDFWWYRCEANWSLVLTLAIRKIPFCTCLIRQRRDLGRELGWNLVRFKKTGCSDRQLGFGTGFAPCVCAEPCAGEHGNTSGRQFLHGAVAWGHGSAAETLQPVKWQLGCTDTQVPGNCSNLLQRLLWLSVKPKIIYERFTF